MHQQCATSAIYSFKVVILIKEQLINESIKEELRRSHLEMLVTKMHNIPKLDMTAIINITDIRKASIITLWDKLIMK